MVATLRSPAGLPLVQTRHDLYQTQLKTNVAFYWLASDTQRVTNYYVRQTNVTVNSDDGVTIEANNVDFLHHCTNNVTSCTTGSRLGTLLWGPNLVFGGKENCVIRTYTNHPCLLSPTSVRCNDINLVTTSLYHQYHCGLRSHFARLVVTTDSQSIALHNTTDFIPISADFSHLYNETRLNPDPQMGLIIKQFNMCTPNTN